jgi:hypothetical protein
VPVTVRVVPDDSVSVSVPVKDSEFMLVEDERLGLRVVVGMTASSAAPGTTPPLQFVAVVQVVLVVPVQVLVAILTPLGFAQD